MMKTASVQTIDYGMVAVSRQVDTAGNDRMVPIGGAATLAEYREDSDLLPPWILPRDLAFGLNWGEIMEAMAS